MSNQVLDYLRRGQRRSHHCYVAGIFNFVILLANAGKPVRNACVMLSPFTPYSYRFRAICPSTLRGSSACKF
jgi:hypothetical protein